MPPGPATYKLRNCFKNLYFFSEPVFILFTNIWNFHGQNSEGLLKLQNLVSQAKNIYIVFNKTFSYLTLWSCQKKETCFLLDIFLWKAFSDYFDLKLVRRRLCLTLFVFALRATGGVASCICCICCDIFFWCVCITDELGWLAVSEWESVCEGSISVVIIVLSFVCVVCVCESVNKS